MAGWRAVDSDWLPLDEVDVGGVTRLSRLAPYGGHQRRRRHFCATSTSGPRSAASRVGDSPIVGAGLYVDNAVGSCGSIGWGEANLENLSRFAAVELMRGGQSPVEAGLAILRRMAEHAHPYQRDEAGKPTFNVRLYLLTKAGAHAGVTLWGPQQMAVTDAQGARLEDCVPLLGSRH